jgi:serine/threonine protein kinase
MEELSELFSKGQRLGKYQLIRRLAVGGMAEIYLAQASGLEGFEKLVVLKRILPQHALDPQLRRMFLDEARLMATLTHPHITQVYDVGAEGDAPFFAMEYVHGATLRELMNAAGRAVGLDHQPREIPLTHAIGILAAAAAGLHFAHQQIGSKGEPLDIVHRDVSPSNVLVTYGGSVKVSDFGIAKWSSQRTQTQEGALKGKFAYMSPEQCRGQPLDRRSDVFALGTLLYELTTGQPPFRAASDYEILNRIVNGELPAPVLPDGPYPQELERIVRRALAPLPDDRYPTAQALQLDLESFARGHGLVLSTVGLGEYMHSLFAQRIADWQRAQQSGKSLKQHLAEIEAVSARLEQSSRPTATDLHALPPDGARRRRGANAPAIAAAVIALAVAGGVAAALQIQIGGRHAANVARASAVIASVGAVGTVAGAATVAAGTAGNS